MNGSTTNLAVGLAALGIGLVAAGVQRSRARKAASVAGKAAAAGSPAPERDRGQAGGAPPEREAQASPPPGKPLVAYFLWVFLLAAPFWVFGDSKLPLPINLPASALVTFVPMIAAALVAYRYDGPAGLRKLLRRAVDFRKIRDKKWYLPALFFMPLIYLLSYAVMRLLGRPLPDPVQIPLLMAPVAFAGFLIGDTGEELGWTGFALEPLQQRWGARTAGLLLGVIWVIWHAIPWLQTGNTAGWIGWQALFSIAFRILIVWIYNGSGKSVFAATLVHVTSNVSWSLFPNYGTHYDPVVTSVVTWTATLAVLLLWEPATLSRGRRAGRAS
jgi:hypothetical protein